jgi:hypothetical protein
VLPTSPLSRGGRLANRSAHATAIPRARSPVIPRITRTSAAASAAPFVPPSRATRGSFQDSGQLCPWIWHDEPSPTDPDRPRPGGASHRASTIRGRWYVAAIALRERASKPAPRGERRSTTNHVQRP